MRKEEKSIFGFIADKIEEWWLFIAYLIGLYMLVNPASNMVVSAWNGDGLLRNSVNLIVEILGVRRGQLAVLLFGAFISLLLMMLLDSMKRMQGILLSFATLLTIQIWAANDIFVHYIVPSALPLITTGLCMGLFFGQGRHVPKRPPWDAKRATFAIFIVATLIIGLAFVDAHFILDIENKNILTDAFHSGSFLVLAFGFAQYEANADMFILGPARGGKTTTTVGLYYSLIHDREDQSIPPNPTDPLVKQYHELVEGNNFNIELNSLLEYKLLRFQYQKGRLFPKKMKLSTLDYSGEYLREGLYKELDRWVPKRRISFSYITYIVEMIFNVIFLTESGELKLGIEQEGTVDNRRGMHELLAKQIMHSDILVFTVDSGSLFEPVYSGFNRDQQQPLSNYLQIYSNITTALNESVVPDKEIYIIMTKADCFDDEYVDGSPGFSRNQSYDNFKYEIESYVRGQDEMLQNLVRQTPSEEIFPVFYQLDVDKTMENNKPVLAEEPQPVGFKEVLESLGD